MLAAYKSYLKFCIFRGSVRSAKGNNVTLIIVCSLFAVTSLILFQLTSELTDPVNYYGRTFVVFATFNVLIFLTLVYRKYPSRYRKVLSAFVGTRTLIDLCMIVIVLLFPNSEDLRQVLTAAIALWRMCIVGYILKDAFEVSLPIGILISIGFTIFSIIVADVSMGLPSIPEVIPSNE